jgi:alpha-L-fucosidase
MFSDAGPDVRWIGNERGSAGETNWSTMNPDAVPYPGADGPGIIAALQNGDPNGTVWRPGETDVSIRPGWFYHPAEDAKVKSGAELVQLYLTSVGRNSKLLLNVPPTRAGLLHETDVARLPEIKRGIAKLLEGGDVLRGRRPAWRTASDGSIRCEVELPGESFIALADLRESIEHGQVVAQYTVEGSADAAPTSWRMLARGTTIGYRKLDVFTPVAVRRLRITLRTIAPLTQPVQVGVYAAAS